MREIKFRAWDLENKRMFEVSYITFKAGGKIDGVMGFGNKKDDEKRIKSGGSVSITADGKGFEYGTLQLQLRNFELMQFTGLLDRHGKEIYEGDIVSYGHKIKSRNTGQFINNGHKLKIIDNPNKGTWRLKEPQKYEVIGNVWENPELIKETK